MEGRPMIDFEGLKLLFKLLGVKTTLKSSRLIAQHGSWLNNYTKVVLDATKKVVMFNLVMLV
jgi:hypothetical protein